jgi:hypothetical protein
MDDLTLDRITRFMKSPHHIQQARELRAFPIAAKYLQHSVLQHILPFCGMVTRTIMFARQQPALTIDTEAL